MPDPPSYDQYLLDRLHALKNTSIQLDPAKPKLSPSKPSTPEQDLSARLRSLRNGSLSPSLSSASKPPPSLSRAQPKPSHESLTSFPATPTSQPKAIIDEKLDNDPLGNPHALETDDKTLDELLAELSPEDQWTLNPDDPKDIQKLLDEAKGALPPHIDPSPQILENKDKSCLDGRAEKRSRDRKENENQLTRDLDMSVFTLNDEEGEAHSDQDHDSSQKKTKAEILDEESREAQDIVKRILDEVNLERENEPPPQSSNSNVEEGEEPTFILPSTPSNLQNPSGPSRKPLDFESDISIRMAALRGLSSLSPLPSAPKSAPKTDFLGLPSAPTFKPAEKPTKTIHKKFTDEEIDSWCIICQDDATVRCMGCDGDLYCANCWKEGHMGPDVGYEERMHKWTKWRPSR